MPKYKSRRGITYEYVSLPGLLWENNSITFNFSSPAECLLHIGISDSLVPLLFSGAPSPESIMFKLYPAFKKHLGDELDKGCFEHWLKASRMNQAKYELFTENRYKELINLIEKSQPKDEEKLQIFLSIAAHNVFADDDVPTSIRLLAGETGISQENIRHIVQQAPNKFQLVSNDFVFLLGGYDL
jgi:hypothetical protein